LTQHRSSRKPLAVLTDFDGTLTVKDVGVLLLDTFASPEWRKEPELWRKGLIETFKELNEREFSYLPAAKEREMAAFAVANTQLRDGALELVEYCRNKSIPLEIVSGGLDFYMRPVLDHHGLTTLPVLCLKHADFSSGDFVVPTYAEEVVVCDITGACKCSRIWHYQVLGYEVIYLGDGNSDRCPATQADVLFARDALAGYCDEKRISYKRFESMREVVAFLKSAT